MIDVHGRAQAITEDKKKFIYFEDNKILSLVFSGLVDYSLLWKQCTMINDHVLALAITEDIFFCPKG